MPTSLYPALWACLVWFLAGALPLAAGTAELLGAPKVRSRLRVQLDSAARKLTYAVDGDETFRELKGDSLFLTGRSIFVTYPRLNPLRLQANAAVSAVDDPAHSAVAKLIESILSITSIVKPDRPQPVVAPAGETTCPAGGPAATDIATLASLLYGPATLPVNVRREVDDWVAAVDTAFAAGKPGPDAIRSAISAIKRDSSNGTGLLPALDKSTAQAPALVTKVEEGAVSAHTPCDQTLYRLALMTNPRARLQQLKALKAAVEQTAELLSAQYAVEAKWINGTDYKISEEIEPTAERMRSVEVKVATITFRVDEAASALVAIAQDAGLARFTVRRYAQFEPEVGVGVVFAAVNRPQYGTAKNSAGATVVARVPDTSLAINPTLTVNFVCRCGLGSLAPMLQIGAATSKDSPALLLGGGLRLFGLGKGDLAIGGGVMFAWVKDLRALKDGDPVSGTKDIEADLAFESKPRTKGYLSILYKF